MTELGNHDAQSGLLKALRNDSELNRLTAGGFHNRVAEQDAPFPRVVYTQLNNRPTAHADDDEVKATVNFQISIFNTAETVANETAMIKVLDRIMKSLEYGKYDQQPFYETDTKIYHVALRYKKNFY